MNLKDILVHIDDRPTCSSRLTAAMKLAKQQQSRLTGIYIIPPAHYYDRPEENLAVQAEQMFSQRTEEAGLQAEWVCIDSQNRRIDVANVLNRHAHYRDLLVISQTDDDSPDRFIPDNLPEKTVLGSGRPILIVPYAGDFDHDYRQIMLAWRGGPESARALHDALPVLRTAQEVKVISVFDQEDEDSYQSPGMDVCRHMARYQLRLSSEKRLSGELKTGDMILNRCADTGANLLVMGATSQSRRGTQTLGETGRYMLKSMTLPVLMSH